MKTTFAAACAAALIVAGCQGDTEPAAPPTSQDALTTTDAAPTTAPPDDVEATTEPQGDAEATTEAAGPPELPEEATEDSEAGAEAFALHYVDMINYTSRHPEVGLLPSLSSEDCASCTNRESSVSYSADHGERMERDLFIVGDSVSLHDPDTSSALVRIDVEQVGQDVVNDTGEIVDTVEDQQATLVFDLAWSDGWSVQEIQVDVGKQ